jgi:hypothetical protein
LWAGQPNYWQFVLQRSETIFVRSYDKWLTVCITANWDNFCEQVSQIIDSLYYSEVRQFLWAGLPNYWKFVLQRSETIFVSRSAKLLTVCITAKWDNFCEQVCQIIDSLYYSEVRQILWTGQPNYCQFSRVYGTRKSEEKYFTAWWIKCVPLTIISGISLFCWQYTFLFSLMSTIKSWHLSKLH